MHICTITFQISVVICRFLKKEYYRATSTRQTETRCDDYIVHLLARNRDKVPVKSPGSTCQGSYTQSSPPTFKLSTLVVSRKPQTVRSSKLSHEYSIPFVTLPRRIILLLWNCFWYVVRFAIICGVSFFPCSKSLNFVGKKEILCHLCYWYNSCNLYVPISIEYQ